MTDTPSPIDGPAFEDRDATGRVAEAIIAAGRRLGARGLIAAAEGNVSVRLGDDWMLITPSGLRKDELTTDDLILAPLERVDAPEHPKGLRPSSDIAIHRAIYEARPDIDAVAHAHIAASMSLTLAGHTPDPVALPETALHLPRLPLVPLAAMGSDELAVRIANALVEAPAPLPGAVLLERHGAVAVGSGRDRAGASDDPRGPLHHALAQAIDRLELIDVLCRVWRDAILLRAGTTVTR